MWDLQAQSHKHMSTWKGILNLEGWILWDHQWLNPAPQILCKHERSIVATGVQLQPKMACNKEKLKVEMEFVENKNEPMLKYRYKMAQTRRHRKPGEEKNVVESQCWKLSMLG